MIIITALCRTLSRAIQANGVIEGIRKITQVKKNDRDEDLKSTFFFTFNSKNEQNTKIVVKSGVSCSSVGKETLNKAMESPRLSFVCDCSIMEQSHRFETSEAELKALLEIILPILCETTDGET